MAKSIQWLNANAYRRYPFIEDESLDLAVGGAIADAVLLDIRAVSYTHQQQAFELASVEILDPGGPKVAVFNFRYAISGLGVAISVPENAALPFESTQHNAQSHHVTCVFGSGISELFQKPAGIYHLSVFPAVEPALVAYQPEHRVFNVRASGPFQTDELSGVIHVREGHNCQIAILPQRDTVQIAAVKGAGRGISCETIDDDILLCPDVLLRLNGMRAGDLGEFILLGEDGVMLVPDPDNHLISIRLSQPDQELECG